MREALRGLDVTLLLAPSGFEGEGFWDDFRHAPALPDTWRSADLAVLPAVVEARPKALLEALAAGIPVLASRECGLHPGCGARFVPALNASALRRAVLEQLEIFPSTLGAR